MQKLPQSLWLERCAHRIVEVDHDIAAEEARRIARDLQSFERTGVMEPEAAVDFVTSELSQAQPGPFERRSQPRS